MTLNELIARLQELANEGHGEATVIANHEAVEEANFIERDNTVYL